VDLRAPGVIKARIYQAFTPAMLPIASLIPMSRMPGLPISVSR
jgi:hypothetical protein